MSCNRRRTAGQELLETESSRVEAVEKPIRPRKVQSWRNRGVRQVLGGGKA